MKTQYSTKVEARMRAFYESLSEKDRRRYAAVEAEKLEHGGTEYIAVLFGCDPNTIRRGGKMWTNFPRTLPKAASEKKVLRGISGKGIGRGQG